MGAKMAQSRMKTIDKLKKEGPLVPIDTDNHKPVLKLPTPPRGSQHLLSLEGVKLAWDKSCAEKGEFILHECNIRLERGT